MTFMNPEKSKNTTFLDFENRETFPISSNRRSKKCDISKVIRKVRNTVFLAIRNVKGYYGSDV